MSTVPFPSLFLDRMSRFLGAEYPAFAAELNREPISGLRLNTLKIGPEKFRRISPFPLGEGVPWCPSAFLLEGDVRPGKHPYQPAGLYYLQDPSAMSAAELLGPQPGERVLDLAASPGGKTTHLASLMQGHGLLVANEIKTRRLNSLVVNAERWGAANIVVTNENPERLADHFGAAFDRVLVDAPCSGEGTFRRDMQARLDWSREAIASYAEKQNSILRVAAHLVRPGGYLLYSTCTFAPEEDEGSMERFLREHAEFEVVALPLLPGFIPGQPEWLEIAATDPDELERGSFDQAHSGLKESLRGSVRILPDRVPGEGHFVCLLQRLSGEARDRGISWGPDFISAGQVETWQAFEESCLIGSFPRERLRLQGQRLYLVSELMPDLNGLRVAIPGIWLGTFKTNRFEPAHALALYLHKEQAQNVLDLPAKSREISAYMRGESIPAAGDPGWVLVCVDGFPLGWGKRVQGVVKNHFPRGWQVLS
ncbi:MAG: RsmB/NOP family class I SAM-dependent RNA methyltransferase [Anaerolineales bacterium]